MTLRSRRRHAPAFDSAAPATCHPGLPPATRNAASF